MILLSWISSYTKQGVLREVTKAVRDILSFKPNNLLIGHIYYIYFLIWPIAKGCSPVCLIRWRSEKSGERERRKEWTYTQSAIVICTFIDWTLTIPTIKYALPHWDYISCYVVKYYLLTIYFSCLGKKIRAINLPLYSFAFNHLWWK